METRRVTNFSLIRESISAEEDFLELVVWHGAEGTQSVSTHTEKMEKYSPLLPNLTL